MRTTGCSRVRRLRGPFNVGHLLEKCVHSRVIVDECKQWKSRSLEGLWRHCQTLQRGKAGVGRVQKYRCALLPYEQLLVSFAGLPRAGVLSYVLSGGFEIFHGGKVLRCLELAPFDLHQQAENTFEPENEKSRTFIAGNVTRSARLLAAPRLK